MTISVKVGGGCWVERIATFIWLHILAWRVLFGGEQNITKRCSVMEA